MDIAELKGLVDALIAAIPTLPAELVDKVIQVISSIDDDAERDRALEALAMRLIELDEDWKVYDVIEAIADPATRGGAFVRVADSLLQWTGGTEVAWRMYRAADMLPTKDGSSTATLGGKARLDGISYREGTLGTDEGDLDATAPFGTDPRSELDDLTPPGDPSEPRPAKDGGKPETRDSFDDLKPRGSALGYSVPSSDTKSAFEDLGGGGADPAALLRALRDHTPASAEDPAAVLRALLDRSQARAPRQPGPALSSGFAASDRAGETLPPEQPLICNQTYYFWLAIQNPGRPRPAHAIDTATAPLPIENLPEDARLTVALFSVHGGLAITPGQDVGELHILPGGSVEITRQPANLEGIDAGLARTRLFFPVRAPAQAGEARLRCNIYYRDTLVQSRLITAAVAETRSLGPAMTGQVLRADIDYQLAHSLEPETLSAIKTHALSLLLGGEREGTHSFRFFGAAQFKSEAVIDDHTLAELIARARRALRKAAWGSPEPWDKHDYRYGRPAPLAQLGRDLIELAICGYRMYDTLINRLAGGYDAAEKLAAIMRAPGQVQIALERSPRAVVPVALLYDHGLETNAPPESYRLCETAAGALERGHGLAGTPCFTEQCPNHDDILVVCPSGFWGYRHALGMPLHSDSARHPPVEIRHGHELEFSVAVSTDPAFKQRAGHEQRLQALRPDLVWRYANDRNRALQLLSASQPHLVYFYCHGGVADNIPYLQVGPRSERGITRENLRLHRIRWERTRPLVFLNGCHTTALSPEVAMDLVSAFVENAAACGVIGTEITVFEPLACAFAEAFYGHVLAGLSVGEAVRSARLSLLEARNPLGLVYIPYVLASARLQREHGDNE